MFHNIIIFIHYKVLHNILHNVIREYIPACVSMQILPHYILVNLNMQIVLATYTFYIRTLCYDLCMLASDQIL